MNFYDFERRAAAAFGPEWRKELPRHYGITGRAMRYWQNGETAVPHRVATDLLAWSAPHGFIPKLRALIERAIEDVSFPDAISEYTAFDELNEWLGERQAAVSRRVALENAELKRRAEILQIEEHDHDVLMEDRHFAWLHSDAFGAGL